MKISVLGPKGTFSEVAWVEYQKKNGFSSEAIYYNTIDECVIALSSGKCDYAIVPVENTLDGYVQKTLDLLLYQDVYIIDEISIPVQFKLVSNCADKNEIRTVFAQFKASNQCKNLIHSLNGVIINSTESNMISYYRWNEEQGNSAAIIPSHIQTNAELVIEDVADSKENYTRFLVLKKTSNPFEPSKKNGKIKTSLFVVPTSDCPGLLYNILKIFAEGNVNLTSIISRPTKKKMGTYNFYIDMECSINDYVNSKKCLEEIKQKYPIKVLGNYVID